MSDTSPITIGSVMEFLARKAQEVSRLAVEGDDCAMAVASACRKHNEAPGVETLTGVLDTTQALIKAHPELRSAANGTREAGE